MEEITLDQIIDYVKGALDKESTKLIEERIKKDPEFAHEVEMYRGFQKLLGNDAFLYEHFSSKVDSSSLAKRAIGNIKHLKYYTYAAAAVIALLLTYFTLLRDKQSYTPDALFASYFKEYNQIIEMRDGIDSTGMFNIGIQQYKEGDWESAIHSLNQSKQNFQLTASFYIGMCYLELKEYEKARKQLIEVVKHPNEFRQEAQWYLALAYLAEHNLERCSKILNEISFQPDHQHKAEADRLLVDLEKIE
jgi:tetratricopeptide (TPR) repeat protein